MKTNLKTQLVGLIIFIVLGFHIAFSQAPATVWSVRYSGPSNAQDSVIAICSNSNGNIFVTGWSVVPTISHYIVTIRYNPLTGDSMWVSRYTGTGSATDLPYAIVADNNACYMTGYTLNSINNKDIVTIKYDANTGSQLWIKTYNGPGGGGDYGEAITVDNNGNVYIAGRTDNGGTQKMIVLKYDASGNVPSGWPVIYTGSSSGIFDEAHSIKIDASGNVYITGLGRAVSSGPADFLTLKINSGGIVQWAKKYNGTSNGDDIANALVLDASSQFLYVSGYASMSGSNIDFMTIKYNAMTGDSIAAAIYNGPGNGSDIVNSMTIDPLNNVYITGLSWWGSGYNFATIKYNSNLQSQWVVRSTNSGNAFANSIAYSQGFVYVIGTVQGSGTGYDYLTTRIDASNGSVKWNKTENGTASGNDWGTGIVVNDTNNVFITGSANFGNLEFYTLRYQEPVGIIPISREVPKNYSLSQNYPNPFNPSTTIKFDIAKSTFVKLSVYDILGREITTLVNDRVLPGTYEVKWDPAGISSGIYFYKMVTSDVTLTKKMIFNK